MWGKDFLEKLFKNPTNPTGATVMINMYAIRPPEIRVVDARQNKSG